MALPFEAASPRADAVRERLEALERFARWDEGHPTYSEPTAALSGVGLLYDLLPVEARRRPIATAGVRKLHRSLAVLGTTTR